MGKAKKYTARNAAPRRPAKQRSPQATGQAWDWSVSSFRIQTIILASLGLIFYANTFQNEFALDDNPAIKNNKYVQSGFAGIGHLLTSDAMETIYVKSHTDGKLAGGRYRPLSLVTFAVEQQLLGINDTTNIETDKARSAAYLEKMNNDMHFRHVVNVILYILSVIVLLLFLRQIVFVSSPVAAFLAAIIFLIHPVHTEVVANVKSRDELLSLLFILLTFINAYRYYDTRRTKQLIYMLVCFFLALLAKEYAVMLFVLLPVSLFCFRQSSFAWACRSVLILLVPFSLYLALRLSSVAGLAADAGTDIMNNPFLLATPFQKYASIMAVLLDYMKLLFVPSQLSCDYNYNQLPYSDFSSIKVWLSALIYMALPVAAYLLIRRRHVVGFAIVLYLAFLLPVSNLLINIGAPMGERLIYHSSVGFSIIAGWLLFMAYVRLSSTKNAKGIVGGIVLTLVIASAVIVIPRNYEWKNDVTLFLKDVTTVPNSASANAFAGSACLLSATTDNIAAKNGWLQRSIGYLSKAITINPQYTDAYVNRGMAYLQMGDFDHALWDCDTVLAHFPAHPNLHYLSLHVSDHYLRLGLAAYEKKDYDHAFPLFEKALSAAPYDPDLWYNIAFAYYNLKLYPEAKMMAEKSLALAPNNTMAKQLYTLSAQGGK